MGIGVILRPGVDALIGSPAAQAWNGAPALFSLAALCWSHSVRRTPGPLARPKNFAELEYTVLALPHGSASSLGGAHAGRYVLVRVTIGFVAILEHLLGTPITVMFCARRGAGAIPFAGVAESITVVIIRTAVEALVCS